MEVVEIFQDNNFDVISLYEEPEPHKFKIYVKKPIRPVYAEDIINFIQSIAYEVTLFDNRYPDYMCIHFRDDTYLRPKETLFHYADYRLLSSSMLPDVPLIYGCFKQKTIKVDGKKTVEIKNDYLTNVPFEPTIE